LLIIHADLAHPITWLIAALVIFGILFRPWGLSEALWAVAGAVLLVAGSLLSWHQAWAAVARGTNVYLFLAGMMLLSELARAQGLFEWIAARAVRAARGAPRRLFMLVYLVGIVVTALLSNDATAVVLTPAVYAATRQARTEPLPYLLICAFIANAASFLLPIANPANLVVYDNHLPRLGPWLAQFLLPSVLAVGVTFFVLRATQRAALAGTVHDTPSVPALEPSARLAATGIALTVIVLLWASATGRMLGPPTFVAAVLTVALTLASAGRNPWPLVKGVSWSILPLVAGLFVLVSGLARTGLLGLLRLLIADLALRSGVLAGFAVGTGIAAASNVMNNLPMALVAASLGTAHGLAAVRTSMLIGVDLGPNLSVTGSLATLLWLVALRREQVRIDSLTFLKIGVLVMPPALLAALAASAFVHPI
jgi:arsenical pump membrane protein